MGKGKRKKARKSHKIRNIGLVIVVVAFTIIVAYVASNQSTNSNNDGELKAAILDSLYTMDENQDFLSEANQTLSEAGYKVDIYIGENVTVELFKELPSLNYKIIILRVHTAWESNPTGSSTIAFFTGTPFNELGYYTEKWLGEVREGTIEGYPTHFFAVTQELVHFSQGSFPDSIVIVDSCYGLNSNSMAQAFIEKGASVYIAWDEGVYSSYSDNATLILIDNLLNDMTVEEAINNTPKENDGFGSKLSYYPDDNGDVRLN